MRTKYSIINQTEIYFSGQASKLSRHEVCQSAGLHKLQLQCVCKAVWADNESKLSYPIQTSPIDLLFPSHCVSPRWTNTRSENNCDSLRPNGNSDCCAFLPKLLSTKSFQLYIAAKNKCNDHYGETDRNITWMIRRQFIQCQFYPHSSQQGDTHSQLSHRKRGGERRVRYLICPLFGHPSPLLINCKCSNWQQLLGSQIKQMNENYTSFRSASLLHNHTVPAALERENRNLACVTDLTRWHLNEISWQFQLDCLSTPQAALWENGTEAHNKVAGNDNLTQDTTVSINGKALWAKHARLTTLWPSCWPVLHL